MRREQGHVRLTATDLAAHLACRHLTRLDREVAEGVRDRPAWRDPAAEVLAERGRRHEAAYVAHLAESGLEVVRIGESARAETRAAMERGADAIVQGELAGGRWFGRTDVLLKVDLPSDLGDWSYEVVDTKLARETKGGTVLQLCAYSHLLERAQGVPPESMYVVSPETEFARQAFRHDAHSAYYRFVKARLERETDGELSEMTASYPEPVEHCAVCSWWKECDGRRRTDDHLSFVAGLTKRHQAELAEHDVGTLGALGRLPAIGWQPRRGADGLERVREQARVQLVRRDTGKLLHELLPRDAPRPGADAPPPPPRGLARLPEPSAGDVFFDLEGDRYMEGGPLEYLWGWVTADGAQPVYRSIWALDRASEKAAFEAFVDEVMRRFERWPDMHVYHFAPYEPSALKRLMGRYATREDEIDRLLRGGRLVDLYAALKQGVRASVERYSIKELEPFYGFERPMKLEDARVALRTVEHALELGFTGAIPDEARDGVARYNEDDCVSTLRLRDWLEGLRAGLLREGETVERPALESGAASEQLDERLQAVQELAARLCEGVPVDCADRTDAEHARWLLAQLLGWHRRENKSGYWEYFRLKELDDADLLHEREAIAGLELVERLETRPRGNVVDRYRYPEQETKLKAGDDAHVGDGTFGAIEAIDVVRRTVDVKKSRKRAEEHPSAVFLHKVVRAPAQEDALMRLGAWVAEHGVESEGEHRIARDLLLRAAPRARGHTDGPLRREGESTLDAARRLAPALDGGLLPIQGPPGAGKTYTAARMITALVRAGLRVGVTAPSHKVIRNLLDETVRAAAEDGVPLVCAQKVREKQDPAPAGILEVKGNPDVLAALESGEAQVGAGTAWLWPRAEYAGSVDVLFVDEAGQLSLANTLAIAQAARRGVVLLGDPRQLDQPSKGSHPEGAEASALDHVLGDDVTIADDRGLFLGETWRMHPTLADFTSTLFYAGKLTARAELAHQALAGDTPFAGAGLWYVPVESEANQSSSVEEAEAIAGLVQDLTSGSVRWIDADEREHDLELEHLRIVAPYNAQVAALRSRLPDGAHVGTVDKFQGQEAPVVIYSMTSSSPADAPRGMDFLYSANRLNVATSRARCACILVGAPALFEPECRTPAQIELANAFCAYRERATVVPPPGGKVCGSVRSVNAGPVARPPSRRDRD